MQQLPQILNYLKKALKTTTTMPARSTISNMHGPCIRPVRPPISKLLNKASQHTYLRGQSPASPSASRAPSPTPCIQRPQFHYLHVNAVNSCNQTIAQPSRITHLQPRRKRFTRMPGPCIPPPPPPPLLNKASQYTHLRGQSPASPSGSRAPSPTPCIQRLQFDNLHVNLKNLNFN